MIDHVITHIISSKFISNVGKYVVELGIRGEKKRKEWLTEKQMINLEICFDRTRNGRSDKEARVIGYWNDKGYYAYSRVEFGREFKVPPQYNLDDLKEEE
jgi:hypothetical protein